MAKTSGRAHLYVSQISLVGRSHGLVKTLAGFKKQHHTLPDAVNAATTAFLGKLCAVELTAEAEQFFQRARTAFDYKRTDLSLEIASPNAILTAKDFTWEIAYALELNNPTAYSVERSLSNLSDGGFLDHDEFNELFAGQFSGIIFRLTRGARVEAVIDAIEALPPGGGLAVTYPSDCRHCVLTVAGVDAEVVCDGATLEMRFPKHGSPRELVDAFARMRSAFVLTQDQVLAGLL